MSQPGDAPRGGSGRDESLAEAFWAVSRELRHRSQEALAPWDLTPSHARALRVLGHHEQLRLSELSEHLRIAARSTTEVVDALEAQDLVRRTPDPSDRRATLVELTPAGRERIESIRAARDSQGEQFFERLSRSDQAELARLLRALR